MKNKYLDAVVKNHFTAAATINPFGLFLLTAAMLAFVGLMSWCALQVWQSMDASTLPKIIPWTLLAFYGICVAMGASVSIGCLGGWFLKIHPPNKTVKATPVLPPAAGAA